MSVASVTMELLGRIFLLDIYNQIGRQLLNFIAKSNKKLKVISQYIYIIQHIF